MSTLVGITGLQPTVDAIKVSKAVALANKEFNYLWLAYIRLNERKYNTKIITC